MMQGRISLAGVEVEEEPFDGLVEGKPKRIAIDGPIGSSWEKKRITAVLLRTGVRIICRLTSNNVYLGSGKTLRRF